MTLETRNLSALPYSSQMTRNSVHLLQPASPTAFREKQMRTVSKKN